MTTAVLIDDHPVFRDGLKLLFEAHAGPRVVGEASRPEQASDLVTATSPDLVVLDMMFDADVDGVAVATELLRRDPARRILFLTMTTDAGKVSDALRAGALGYVTKDQAAAELLHAIDVVASGNRYLPDVLQRAVEQHRAQGGAKHDRLARLTSREREVFDLTVCGLTAQAAGERLGISARTVETHRARILSKLHAHSAAELVRIAAELGAIPPELS